MKERPIIHGHIVHGRMPLFIPELRQAIRDGLKRQTRRVIKPQPKAKLAEFTSGEVTAAWQAGFIPVKCPYGQPGDIRAMTEPLICGDGNETDGGMAYYADDMKPVFSNDTHEQMPWRWKRPALTSIHMPYEAARTLTVYTDIRVERVQDITDQDAIEEGVNRCNASIPGYARKRFQKLWDQINGKKHPWESNPWVWVVEFKLCLVVIVMVGIGKGMQRRMPLEETP